jgi:hypothetical protein
MNPRTVLAGRPKNRAMQTMSGLVTNVLPDSSLIDAHWISGMWGHGRLAGTCQ